MLKDLHEEHSVSVNDGDTIKSFCSTYNVDEKHVITYINRLKDIDIRKDIRTREADERKRHEAERTYKGLQGLQMGRHPYWKWQDRKIKGKRTWLLPERTWTTIGRKLDKVKAIRCHYYRHINSLWTQTNREVPKVKVTGNQGMKNVRKN